ncbi:MAG: hypothetical protein Q9P01_22690, partial [Anaerolineae bacterium]|nr:hypothetical protein [Anaerolineae bacterium]
FFVVIIIVRIAIVCFFFFFRHNRPILNVVVFSIGYTIARLHVLYKNSAPTAYAPPPNAI